VWVGRVMALRTDFDRVSQVPTGEFFPRTLGPPSTVIRLLGTAGSEAAILAQGFLLEGRRAFRRRAETARPGPQEDDHSQDALSVTSAESWASDLSASESEWERTEPWSLDAQAVGRSPVALPYWRFGVRSRYEFPQDVERDMSTYTIILDVVYVDDARPCLFVVQQTPDGVWHARGKSGEVAPGPLADILRNSFAQVAREVGEPASPPAEWALTDRSAQRIQWVGPATSSPPAGAALRNEDALHTALHSKAPASSPRTIAMFTVATRRPLYWVLSDAGVLWVVGAVPTSTSDASPPTLAWFGTRAMNPLVLAGWSLPHVLTAIQGTHTI